MQPFYLSIIIVGVGGADFTAMDELDGDTIRLTDQLGRKASRDIVQFVPFSNFYNPKNSNNQSARAHLAKEVLAEIPDQFLGFMKSRNITPSPSSGKHRLKLPYSGLGHNF